MALGQRQSDELLYEDEIIKASYVGVSEGAGIEGAINLQLLIENNSDKTIFVYLSDVTANSYSITSGSGIPMIIKPGDKSKQPFILFCANADIEKIEDIEQMIFRIVVEDNDELQEMLKTNELVIER